MINVLMNGDWEKISVEKLQLGTPSFDFESGLYETFRTLGYKPVFLFPHLERLFKSAKKIGLDIEFTQQQLVKMIFKVIQNFDDPNQRVRILAVPEKLIIYASPLNLDKSTYKGVSVMTVKTKRTSPEMKTTDYNTCLKAWEKAQRSNCFEAVLVDKNGDIYEGSRSNIFWVRDGKVFTREKDVLPGVTRQAIIKKYPFSVTFGKLNQTDLSDIDELFITNSGSGIVPVIRVNSQKIGNGKVGRITNNLLVCYDKWINRNIDKL